MVFMLLGGSQSVKIAVPLKACTAKAAEVVGASVPTGILDLVLGKTISLEAVNQ